MKSLKLIIVCCLAFSVLFYAGIQKATAGETFTVSPTEGDDTENIRNALNMAAEAGPGSTVQLTAGTFDISEAIHVTDFDGTFTGTGDPQVTVVHDENGRITSVTRDSGTLIQTVGTEADPWPPAGPPMGVSPAVFGFLMEDLGGSPETAPSITIQDMAVVVTAPATEMRIVFPDGTEDAWRELIVFWVSGRYTLDPTGPSERPFPLTEDGYGRHAGDTCYCNVQFDRVKVTGQMESGDYYSAIPFVYQGWGTDYGSDPETNTRSYDCFWQRMTGSGLGCVSSYTAKFQIGGQ